MSKLGLDVSGMAPSQFHVTLTLRNLLGGHVSQQLVVAPHEAIRDRHRLAVNLIRRLVDADVIAEALRHLVDSVEPFEQRSRHNDFRLLTISTLNLASHEEIEFLIGPPKL